MIKKPDERLADAAKIFAERSVLYGENYLRHGMVLQALFPEGLKLQSLNDHNRFGLLTQVVAKMTRYCENFSKGGHEDSLDDLSVYAQMLNYVDGLIKQDSDAERVADLKRFADFKAPPYERDEVAAAYERAKKDLGLQTPFTSLIRPSLSNPPAPFKDDEGDVTGASDDLGR